jgi:hypothetical protein
MSLQNILQCGKEYSAITAHSHESKKILRNAYNHHYHMLPIASSHGTKVDAKQLNSVAPGKMMIAFASPALSFPPFQPFLPQRLLRVICRGGKGKFHAQTSSHVHRIFASHFLCPASGSPPEKQI